MKNISIRPVALLVLAGIAGLSTPSTAMPFDAKTNMVDQYYVAEIVNTNVFPKCGKYYGRLLSIAENFYRNIDVTSVSENETEPGHVMYRFATKSYPEGPRTLHYFSDVQKCLKFIEPVEDINAEQRRAQDKLRRQRALEENVFMLGRFSARKGGIPFCEEYPYTGLTERAKFQKVAHKFYRHPSGPAQVSLIDVGNGIKVLFTKIPFADDQVTEIHTNSLEYCGRLAKWWADHKSFPSPDGLRDLLHDLRD